MTAASTKPTGTFVDAVVTALERAGRYNRNDQSPPAAVLWPDKERQWEPLLSQLQSRLPIVTVGPYEPALRQGPAYWVRCMLNGTLGDGWLPHGVTPIVYLPGVSKQEIRAVESCPKPLQPLAELQYRGLIWTQKNGRDWTVQAFLQSEDGGLGIETGGDAATKEALSQALGVLAGEAVVQLERQAPLRAPFFHGLLHPDEARTVLQWLDNADAWRARHSNDEWSAFRALCLGKYEFDPERDGPMTAAELLGQRNGAWEVVWRRFEENPEAYSGIPEQLRRGRPTKDLGLFMRPESWPQDNEALETILRERLSGTSTMVPADTRILIRELESAHGRRRDWVWARLGQAPLATALAHLAGLAASTEQVLGGTTLQDFTSAYAGNGWRADDFLLRALAAVSAAEDVAVVKAAARTLYETWADASARAFQTLIGSYQGEQQRQPANSTCLVFVDGFRFDLARRLEAVLADSGFSVDVETRLAPVPSVTASGKPLAAPPLSLSPTKGFDVSSTNGGPALVADGFRRLLTASGVQVLAREEVGQPAGVAWTEAGDIDKFGHEYGWRLCYQVDAELDRLAARCRQLLTAGWERVRVVTDHGWILLPGGMPKVELPEHLTDVRKGRCARLKDSAASTGLVAAWYWDSNVRVTLAPGIACFEANREYEHGGLSPQECVIPVVTVARRSEAPSQTSLHRLRWAQLRCRASSSGAPSGATADIRLRPNDGSTSVVLEPKTVPTDGDISLLVASEDLIGRKGFLVVLSTDGAVLAQVETTIGGDE